ncbi:MAG: hypothetical protein DELT_01266 [Desulfovibrio sp.]
MRGYKALASRRSNGYVSRMFYLGICAIIKDEDRFLDEWLAYYTALGAEAFYLYDNGSVIPLSESLGHYLGHRSAESFRIHEVPGEKLQLDAYMHCVQTYKNQCRWLAFVDMDEFIVPLERASIPELLEGYENFSGLALSWKVFGTNGHIFPPEGLQIESYTRAIEPDHFLHWHVKSVADPSRVGFFRTPHLPGLIENSPPVVDVLGRPVTTPVIKPPVWETAQVNHYYYRSRKEYYAKLRKPRADNNELRTDAVEGRVTAPEGYSEDISAVRFAPKVKTIMRDMTDSRV